MADSKITGLAALTTADPANDMLPIVDVSDNSMAASGTTKRISINNILACSPSATLASATITGDLTVDTSTLKVDSTNNRVGVNITSPTVAFHAGAAAPTRGIVSKIQNSSSATTGAFQAIAAVGANVWSVGLPSGSADLAWFSGRDESADGTERMRLDSSGNLGLGVTPSAWANNTALQLKSSASSISGAIYQGANGGNNANGIAYNCYFDSTNWQYVYGSAHPASRYQQSQGVHSWHVAGSSTGVVAFTQAMTLDASGNLLVGVTSANASGGVLQLKSGITFPATQVASSDANTLDDYEEGTWVPTITAGSGTPTTVVINSATYTKIGRMVTCSFDFSIVNKGTALSSLQFGIPFNSITNTAFCGSFREDGSTGNMGMAFYSTGSTVACLLYNNTTPWVDGYRLKGTYTYFAS